MSNKAQVTLLQLCSLLLTNLLPIINRLIKEKQYYKQALLFGRAFCVLLFIKKFIQTLDILHTLGYNRYYNKHKGLILMAQAAFSVRMDENLKKQFEALCNDFGMNMTTAFTIFAKAVVRERVIPFPITAEPNYNEVTRQAIADVNAGKNLSRRFSSYAEMKAELDAEIDAEEFDA
jgi:DNA-damage-inducible protein J